MRILFAILLLAAVLRFWAIGSNPPSLTWDETAWGYNAYSLGTDARDEFGRFLPLDYIESFGDFKPPMYAYLDILPVKIFGLNEFGVRFPSAFFGVLTVILTYFLVREVFSNSKLKNQYALVSSLFLAISPWHIMLSRAAFEANVASFFIVSGVLFFLLGVRSNARFLTVSLISFVLSMYTFNTARIVSPILILILGILFRRELFILKKQLIIATIIAFVLFLPLFRFLTTPQASLRFKEVNIFSDISYIELSNRQIENDNGAFFSKVLHNRRAIFTVEFLKHYFDNLSPNFLFGKGDGNPKFSIQEVGHLYLWDFPFLVMGTLLIFKRKEGSWKILPLWLVIGIIPAATARETPHALRIEAVLPTFQVLIAYGFVNFIDNFKTKKSLILRASYVFLFINFLYFVHSLFIHYPKEFSGEWQYGYKESVKFVRSVATNYSQINITDQLGRPYIYYLFYTKEDPRTFRKEAKVSRDVFGFVTVENYKKFNFVKDPNIVAGINVLNINLPNKVPVGARVLKTFYLLNGKEALVAYTI